MDDIIVNNKIAFSPLRHYYEVSRELNKLKAFNYILSNKEFRSTIRDVLTQHDNAFNDKEVLLASQNSNASTLCDYLSAANPSETLKKIAKPSSTEILKVFGDVVTASEALKKEIDNCCTKGGELSAEEQLDFVFKIEAQSYNLCLFKEFYSEFVGCNTNYSDYDSTAASIANGKGISFTTIKEKFDKKVKDFSDAVSALRADLEALSKDGSDDNNDDDNDNDNDNDFESESGSGSESDSDSDSESEFGFGDDDEEEEEKKEDDDEDEDEEDEKDEKDEK